MSDKTWDAVLVVKLKQWLFDEMDKLPAEQCRMNIDVYEALRRDPDVNARPDRNATA